MLKGAVVIICIAMLALIGWQWQIYVQQHPNGARDACLGFRAGAQDQTLPLGTREIDQDSWNQCVRDGTVAEDDAG
jgi:hypothetical protein